MPAAMPAMPAAEATLAAKAAPETISGSAREGNGPGRGGPRHRGRASTMEQPANSRTMASEAAQARRSGGRQRGEAGVRGQALARTLRASLSQNHESELWPGGGCDWERHGCSRSSGGGAPRSAACGRVRNCLASASAGAIDMAAAMSHAWPAVTEQLLQRENSADPAVGLHWASRSGLRTTAGTSGGSHGAPAGSPAGCVQRRSVRPALAAPTHSRKTSRASKARDDRSGHGGFLRTRVRGSTPSANGWKQAAQGGARQAAARCARQAEHNGSRKAPGVSGLLGARLKSAASLEARHRCL
jgi:hypothetical protein